MTRLEIFLLVLVVALVGADAAAIVVSGVAVDGPAYGGVALLSGALAAGGIFYRRIRPEPRLAAMLLGCAFLCAFSAAAALLNYLLLAVTGPRIDIALAAWDRALGFSWPVAAAWTAAHPLPAAILFLAYGSMLPQVALLVIALARRPQTEASLRFCCAIALGALLCIGAWTAFPSFGAFSVYTLDPAIAARFHPALGPDYARALVAMLKQGPTWASPTAAQGLIGFPSYHAVMALVAVRFAWDVRALRWPVLLLNLLVLVATPVEGGHHLVDVLAAFAVAWMSLALTSRLAGTSQLRDVVNKGRVLTTIPAPKPAFCIEMTKIGAAAPVPD